MIRHHFTVDLEEHFQVSAFEGFIRREAWSDHESRVELGTGVLLEALARHGASGTFFVLGWLAERRPDLVKRIAGAGHEIASHGWDHRRVTEQSPDQFRQSVRRSRQCLESLSGSPVLGFRAPSFSIIRSQEWALEVLVEEGYRYDSSLFPVRRPGYGYANGNRDPHVVPTPAGPLLEFPPATLRGAGWNLPAAGGAYFRIFPYALVRGALAQFEERGVPTTFYLHPWELDPGQPRLRAGAWAGWRHYTGLGRTRARLERLLGEFAFTSIRDGAWGQRFPAN